MRKVIPIIVIIVSTSLVVIIARRARDVHAQSTSDVPSTGVPPGAPVDALQYGYKPAATPAKPARMGTAFADLPSEQQQELLRRQDLDKKLEPTRLAMVAYSSGVVARAQLIEAVRTAGMELAP